MSKTIFMLHVFVKGITEYEVGFETSRERELHMQFIRGDMTGMHYKLTKWMVSE